MNYNFEFVFQNNQRTKNIVLAQLKSKIKADEKHSKMQGANKQLVLFVLNESCVLACA